MRLFGHHVHHAARVLHAVQHGRRAFQYFHTLGGGREDVCLRHLHAVAQYGIVAVVAEAAFHHGIQRAGQSIGLADAAHGLQGFIQGFGAAVCQYGGSDHVHAARHVQQARVSAADHFGRHGLVTVVVTRCFAGNVYGLQFLPVVFAICGVFGPGCAVNCCQCQNQCFDFHVFSSEVKISKRQNRINNPIKGAAFYDI